MPEGWEDYGAEEYARMCEEAVSFLSTGIRDRRSNPVLCQAVEEATTYLEDYELERARERLIAEGGTPRPIATELGMLRYFEESAQGSVGLKSRSGCPVFGSGHGKPPSNSL